MILKERLKNLASEVKKENGQEYIRLFFCPEFEYIESSETRTDIKEPYLIKSRGWENEHDSKFEIKHNIWVSVDFWENLNEQELNELETLFKQSHNKEAYRILDELKVFEDI